MSAVKSEQLAAIERAMNQIRRRQTRRSLGRLAARERDTQRARTGDAVARPAAALARAAEDAGDDARVLVIDAVEEGAAPPADGVTVGLVAERLGIDPSHASRLVASAVAAGYVRRVASQADGRRICLELTTEGMAVAEEVHRSRRAAFERAMRGWSGAEREEFARLLTRFLEGLERSSS
jgi:DNA-binding MarR family transcriptional regulator